MTDAVVFSAVVSIEADVDAETAAEDGACPSETEHPPIASERIAVIIRTAVILFISHLEAFYSASTTAP